MGEKLLEGLRGEMIRKKECGCNKSDNQSRFLSDPHAVLAEYGMEVPEGVNVVENTDTIVHVTLPAAPTADGDLSDEELASAAGGAEASLAGPCPPSKCAHPTVTCECP